MKKLFFYIGFTLLFSEILAQAEYFSIGEYDFEVVTEIASNEWNTSDTIKKLYRIENGEAVYLLKFYPYKDEGSDCNNVFWDKETMTIKSDSIIFDTQYFQKTGMDPIPEYRKQIYKIDSLGKLILIYDKYKFRYDDKWVEQ